MAVMVELVVMEALATLVLVVMAADGGPDELAEVPSALVLLVATVVVVTVVLMQDGGAVGVAAFLF